MAAGAGQILQGANQAIVQAQAHSAAVDCHAEALAERAIARQSQEVSPTQQEVCARLTNAEHMVAQRDRDLFAAEQQAADRLSQIEGLLVGKDRELGESHS